MKGVKLVTDSGEAVRFDEIVVLSVLNDLIAGNRIIRDEAGFENYLREEHGKYFLARTLAGVSSEVLIAERPFALVQDNSDQALELLCNGLSISLLNQPDKLNKLIRLESPETKEIMLETAFVKSRIGGYDSRQDAVISTILSELGGHLHKGTGPTEGLVWSDLLEPSCYRGVMKAELGAGGSARDRLWCGGEVGWAPPAYWRDIERPDADISQLKQLFVKAVTWPANADDPRLRIFGPEGVNGSTSTGYRFWASPHNAAKAQG